MLVLNELFIINIIIHKNYGLNKNHIKPKIFYLFLIIIFIIYY